MCWLEPQVEPTRLAEISRAEEANQKDTGAAKKFDGRRAYFFEATYAFFYKHIIQKVILTFL